MLYLVSTPTEDGGNAELAALQASFDDKLEAAKVEMRDDMHKQLAGLQAVLVEEFRRSSRA